MQCLTFELAKPHPLLSPNARPKHWSDKAAAVCHARHDAYLLALAFLNGLTPPRWSRVALTVDWPWRSDLDNALASLKPTIDGIADAGVIVNDRGILSITIRRAKGHAAVLTVAPIEDQPVSQPRAKARSP